MVVSVLVGALLAAAPDVSIVVASDRPGALLAANLVATQVQNVLQEENISAADTIATEAALKGTKAPPPRTCTGNRSCALKVAEALGPNAVLVAVDVGKLGASLVIHVEALRAGREAPLAVADVTAKQGALAKSLPQLRPFAAALAVALKQAPEPTPAPPTTTTTTPVADAPVAATAVTLTPEPRAEAPRADVTARPSTNVIALTASITAGVLAATAVLFLVLGLGPKAEYESARIVDAMGRVGTRLELPQAQRLVSQANTAFTVSLVAGIAAVAAGGLAGYAWARPSSDDSLAR